MIKLAKLRDVSEIVIGFIAVCYATGILILAAHYNHLGLHDPDLELFKLRNILTGGMFWLTPIFALIPVPAYWYVAKEISPRRGRLATGLLAYAFLLSFYVFLCFVPLQTISAHLVQIAVGLLLSLGGAIAGELLDHRYPKHHYKWIAASLVLFALSVLLLRRVLLTPAIGLWRVASHLPFWVVFSSWIFIVGTIYMGIHVVKGLPKEKETNKWVWVAVGLTVFCLYVAGVYAFAYGVFPFIPSARGGGNLSESRSAIIIFTSDAASSGIPVALLSSGQAELPENCSPATAALIPPVEVHAAASAKSSQKPKLSEKPVLVFCSKRLQIVDQTTETLYVAIFNTATDASFLGRPGEPNQPIYGIPRKHIALLVFQPA